MTAPDFWFRRHAWQAYALSPLALAYDMGRRLRTHITTPMTVDAAVLCVGNLTVGGAGKTPTVRALAHMAQGLGLSTAVATRGYGGALAGPVLVDSVQHAAAQVGDEALLLAQTIPVWKAVKRAVGVMAAAQDHELVIMDDGKQNPTIAKTATVLVVDGGAGFGNGWVLPSGPMREPITSGVHSADMIIVIADPGGAKHPHVLDLERAYGTKIIPAHVRVLTDVTALSVVEAVVGIGRPEKFLTTVQALGLEICRQHVYSDHYAFGRAMLERLIDDARAPLVTTEKDLMRIPMDLRSHFTALTIEVVFEDAAAVANFLRHVAERPAVGGR